MTHDDDVACLPSLFFNYPFLAGLCTSRQAKKAGEILSGLRNKGHLNAVLLEGIVCMYGVGIREIVRRNGGREGEEARVGQCPPRFGHTYPLPLHLALART